MSKSKPPRRLGADLTRVFQQASGLHAQGRLLEAEQFYRIVLGSNDRHADSICRLGIIRLQQDRLDEAERLFCQAIEFGGGSVEAEFHLGIALLGMNRAEEAIEHFQIAAGIRPDFADAHDRLGHALQTLGRHQEAVEHHKKALAINPTQAAAWNNLGYALNSLGRPEEAIKQFLQALAIRPSYPEAHNNLGHAFASLGRLEEAVEHFNRALASAQNYLHAHLNLASALTALDRHDEAISHFERVLASDPDNADAHIGIAGTFLMLDRCDEAISHCDTALAVLSKHTALPPDVLQLHELGNLLWRMRRPKEAVTVFERALALQPNCTPALVSRGIALQELGQFEEALAGFSRAQTFDPAYPDAHFAEGCSRLRLGDFRTGFEKYEWRRRKKIREVRRTFVKPIWRGEEDIAGKVVLVHAEQGFGDTIQFCRYTEMLAARGARVVLEVQPQLKPLLASVAGVSTMVAVGEDFPEFDMYCPMASLPLAFKTNLETIPGITPYLTASADRVGHWRERLGPKTKPRIGLAWAGNSKQANDHNRSMSLSNLLPLFSPDLQFISLQKEVRKRDLETLKDCPGLLNLGDELADFADTAAIVSMMDVVISVCTAVGHLSGALNRPTWFLLSASADWRWLLERNDSPWYPSARLFRQPSLGDWASVVDQVAGELANLKGTLLQPDRLAAD